MRILNTLSLIVLALMTGGLIAEYSSKKVAWRDKTPMPSVMQSATYYVVTGTVAKGFAYKCVTITDKERNEVFRFLSAPTIPAGAVIDNKLIGRATGTVKKVLYDFKESLVDTVKQKFEPKQMPGGF